MAGMGARFRDFLKRPEPVIGVGVSNALEAMAAVLGGAECIYASGYSMALARGLPDLGLMSSTDVIADIGAIVRTSEVPVIADFDDGYGNILNLIHTLREALGRRYYDPISGQMRHLAAFHIEDQAHPKRCGHSEELGDKKIVSVEEMTAKIRAACDIRDSLSPHTAVIARTDSYISQDPEGMRDAISRGRTYADAGADMMWCEFGKPYRASAALFASRMKKSHPKLPLMFNYSPSLSWHKEKSPMTFQELGAMGYKCIIVSRAAEQVVSSAVHDFAKDLADNGAEAVLGILRVKECHPTGGRHTMSQMDRWQGLAEKYRSSKK